MGDGGHRRGRRRLKAEGSLFPALTLAACFQPAGSFAPPVLCGPVSALTCRMWMGSSRESGNRHGAGMLRGGEFGAPLLFCGCKSSFYQGVDASTGWAQSVGGRSVRVGQQRRGRGAAGPLRQDAGRGIFGDNRGELDPEDAEGIEEFLDGLEEARRQDGDERLLLVRDADEWVAGMQIPSEPRGFRGRRGRFSRAFNTGVDFLSEGLPWGKGRADAGVAPGSDKLPKSLRSLAKLNWGMSRQQLRNWLDSPRLPDAEDVIAASALAIATVLLIKLVLFLLAFLVRLSLSLLVTVAVAFFSLSIIYVFAAL